MRIQNIWKGQNSKLLVCYVFLWSYWSFITYWFLYLCLLSPLSMSQQGIKLRKRNMPEQISELNKVIGGQAGSNFLKLYVYNLTSSLVFLHSTILCWDKKNIPSYFIPNVWSSTLCVLKNLSSSIFLAKLLFALVTFKPNWRHRGLWLYFLKAC